MSDLETRIEKLATGESRRMAALDALHFDPANARKHSPKNIEAIRGSLLEYGQQKPIVVDEAGKVLAGNGTLEAAKALGLDELWVVVTDLDEWQRVGYAIADNRTAELAEWDEETLGSMLEMLRDSPDANLEATGFDEAAAEEAIRAMNPPEVVEDEAPPPPEEPVTRPGDLWLLGPHRVLCGDSTEPDHVALACDSRPVDLLVTDPPYNVAYEGKTKERKTIQNDRQADEDFRAFLVAAMSSAFASMKPGAAFYVWHADSEGFNFRGSIHDCGEQVRQCLIWVKQTMVLGRQDYQWQHEPCLYGWKAGAAHGWYSDRTQTTLLSFDRPSRSEEHPTMKPVALVAYQIGNSTAPQGRVLDSFLGSGSTLLAAEQLGRACCGVELDPRYVDVVVRRWEAHTGQQATLEATGQTFDEVAAEREGAPVEAS